MYILFLTDCMKLAGEDAQLPIFCLEWTHPQSKLHSQSSGTFLLPQRKRQNDFEPLPVSSACRAVVTFVQDSAPTHRICIPTPFTVFCRVKVVLMWHFAIQQPVRQVWNTQMERGVCTIAGRGTESCWALVFQSTATVQRLDECHKWVCIYQEITWNPQHKATLGRNSVSDQELSVPKISPKSNHLVQV